MQEGLALPDGALCYQAPALRHIRAEPDLQAGHSCFTSSTSPSFREHPALSDKVHPYQSSSRKSIVALQGAAWREYAWLKCSMCASIPLMHMRYLWHEKTWQSVRDIIRGSQLHLCIDGLPWDRQVRSRTACKRGMAVWAPSGHADQIHEAS
jgi:hypothetical protein